MGAVHLTSQGKMSDVWDPHVRFSLLKSLFSPYMFIRRQNKADAHYFYQESLFSIILNMRLDSNVNLNGEIVMYI